MFRIGFAFEPYQTESQRVTTSIQLNHPNDNSENLSLGAEYAYTIPEIQSDLFLRSGYKVNVDEQDFSFGAGVHAPFSFAQVTVDYSYVHMTKLGSSQRFSIILGL
ncbi:MAG: hypothetical protein HYV28_16680 [Ignavibacteriales bacterium]|nr:hypothetical protein [Ignavibacteriales bacterium]